MDKTRLRRIFDADPKTLTLDDLTWLTSHGKSLGKLHAATDAGGKLSGTKGSYSACFYEPEKVCGFNIEVRSGRDNPLVMKMFRYIEKHRAPAPDYCKYREMHWVHSRNKNKVFDYLKRLGFRCL